MFIGHFGAAFAAKKISPRPSLGTLIMASQFIDLLWPLFLLLGIEHVEIDPGNTAFTPLHFIHYPFTHSVVGVLFWAVLFGGVYYARRRDVRSAVLLGGLVLSHWLLDLIVHAPDLPLLPGGDVFVGLGLWNSIGATLVVEGVIFTAGLVVYIRTMSSEGARRNGKLWSLVAFLLVVYVMNVFGPPPPAADAIGYVGLSMWLLVAWGYWVERETGARMRARALSPSSWHGASTSS
ncbi:MAG: metal-dependent hydrolase [Bacteroidota bacterium]|nr:metal-dependent hydrolase [Bacteroidota bacterium]